MYYGRPANDPEVLFRLLFPQNLYQLSGRQVITDCQVNLTYKWFLKLNPEDPLHDPSPNSLDFGETDSGKLALNECLLISCNNA
ncbi:transposase [Thermoactinomyces mirandus]|uniref:Transposase n=1 Tax=Thermoactinomyces mirandus TaxID=2756294 RepID=A0A7W1XPG4_9BACL|nr:transposase [Thermoactinomyces mirandus]